MKRKSTIVKTNYKKGHFELNSNFESDQFSNGQNCQIRAYKIGLKVGPKWFYNLPWKVICKETNVQWTPNLKKFPVKRHFFLCALWHISTISTWKKKEKKSNFSKVTVLLTYVCKISNWVEYRLCVISKVTSNQSDFPLWKFWYSQFSNLPSKSSRFTIIGLREEEAIGENGGNFHTTR